MLNNEVVPEGATHKWAGSRSLAKWYKPGDYSEALVFRDDDWVSSAFENDDLNDTNCFTPIETTSHKPPSIKDWDDRYPSVHDDVNHPKHYQLGGGLEAIDVIRASLTDEEYRGYLKGSVLKYKLRCGSKGDAQKDVDKSEWYKKELEK